MRLSKLLLSILLLSCVFKKRKVSLVLVQVKTVTTRLKKPRTSFCEISQWPHHVESTSIRRRPNFDKFPRHLHVLFRCNFDGQKIHVVFTYFFRRNFDGRKIHVFSTYFFQCNFSGRKIHVVSTYFFRCNFSGRKIHVVSTYFFQRNFDGRKIHVVYTYFFQRNFDGQKFDVVFD